MKLVFAAILAGLCYSTVRADDSTPSVLVADVVQVVPEGIIAEKQIRTAVDSSYRETYSDSGIRVFISGVPKGSAEGDRLSVWVTRSGTYQFTDTQGASRTIQKWVVVPAPPPPTAKPAPKPPDTFNPGSINDPVH
jgi:hypothetical protein